MSTITLLRNDLVQMRALRHLFANVHPDDTRQNVEAWARISARRIEIPAQYYALCDHVDCDLRAPVPDRLALPSGWTEIIVQREYGIKEHFALCNACTPKLSTLLRKGTIRA